MTTDPTGGDSNSTLYRIGTAFKRSFLYRIGTALRQSFFLTLIVLGSVFLILGRTVFDGVVAGMFGIWGTTAVLIGGIAYSIVWYFRRST
jgi:hypothetical protein